jgi:hypothetical protein
MMPTDSKYVAKLPEMEKISYCKLIKQEFTLNCINAKLIGRFNYALINGIPLGNPLTTEDIKNAAVIYMNMLLYSAHHAAHKAVIANASVNPLTKLR